MTDDVIRYDVWIEEALRSVIQRALLLAAEHGLPGEHHFYVTFRTDADGVEIADAGFFSLAEMERMEAVQGLSRWGIEQALITNPGSGLSPDRRAPGARQARERDARVGRAPIPLRFFALPTLDLGGDDLVQGPRQRPAHGGCPPPPWYRFRPGLGAAPDSLPRGGT